MDFIHQIEPYITERDIDAVGEYLRSGGWLTEFTKTAEFEKAVAGFVGAPHAAAVTSGTAALYLSLLAAGIGEGDKVIVPAYTMIATVNAVKWAGAEPVIVDVEPETLCMDMKRVRPGRGCRALIYVSINGRSGDIAGAAHLCESNGLVLIEDACQSLGSKHDGRYLGTFGDAGVYSFTPHKLITTGQGGMVVTGDAEIDKKIRKMKDFHRTAAGTDWHDGVGYNFKFTDLQAVIGIEQMRDAGARIDRKRRLFEKYRERLGGLKSIEFLPTDLEMTAPWFMDIILPSRDKRDGLAGFLKDHGIGARAFYPPLNHQKPYSHYAKGSFPVAEDISYRGLWLPSSIGLTADKTDFICDRIYEFLG